MSSFYLGDHQIMPSSHTDQPACGGRCCPNCKKCNEWVWHKGSCIGARKAEWKRRGTGCRYGSSSVYHDVVSDGHHHSLCVCDKRRKR
ncbi:unnamed protein product [Rotaria sp. Silwood2]|nr:unnamed protein product [Rotaria sp. Silwood2]CAF4456570.1 unnamed protein product [Rotaria sp. Silwood2]